MKFPDVKKRTIIIDTILLIFFLIVALVSFYIAYSFNLIPVRWVSIAAVIVALLFLILLILSLKKIPTWALVIKRIFIVLLVAAIATGGYFLNKSRTTIQKMSKTEQVNDDGTTTITTNLYLITLKEGNFNSVADLENQIIGFQNGSDTENLEFAKTSVDQSINSYTPREELDYTTLYDEMLLGNISAMVISENFYNMSKANITDFEDTIQTLETYAKSENIETKEQKDITKETFTVYLSGIDSTGSPDQQVRTDTNLILIVNPVANHIDMVSLPRDALMPNTALNNANDKLTHTGIYGIQTSVDTISQFFNIPIDYYARISFNSLIEIVDTIGGIDVDVEIDFCEQDENRSFAEDDLICLSKGEQHLNGKQALAYARHRKTEGYNNAGRERAQQRIIRAIINKLLSPSSLGYVNALLDIAPNYIITDMPVNQIANFVSSELDNLQPWTISSITSDTGVYDLQQVASLNPLEGPYDVYLYNQDEVRSVMNAYDGATSQLQMDTFHFNLENLYEDTPEINDDPNIVWDTMATNPH